VELTTERSVITRREPGVVLQDNLSECSLQEDLGGDRGHGGIGQDRSRRIDPPGAGHSVIIQQGDELAAGPAEAQIHATGEPEIARRADHEGPGPAGDGGRFLIGRTVVDHDDLRSLGESRIETFGQPGSGTLGDDDDR
jgi:hypothetical protein